MMCRVCFALLRGSRRAALLASALILLTLASLPLRAQNGIPGMLWYRAGFANTIAYSPDSTIVAIPHAGFRTVGLYSPADGTLLGTCYEASLYSTCVAFSPDGQWLATGDVDGVLRIWRLADGALTHVVTAHGDYVTGIAFSPNSTLLVSGSWDATAALWRVSDGNLVRRLTLTYRVNEVAYSPGAEYVAVGGDDRRARLWRVSDGSIAASLYHPAEVLSVAFSHDGVLLAAGRTDNTVTIWVVSSRTVLRTMSGYGAAHVAFTLDDTILGWGGPGYYVRLNRVSDGQYIGGLGGGTQAGMGEFAFSPDGHYAVGIGGDMTVKVWRMIEYSPVRTLLGAVTNANNIAISPDGTRIASAHGSAAYLWNRTGAPQVIALTGSAVNTVAVSPDGQYVASCGFSGSTWTYWVSIHQTSDGALTTSVNVSSQQILALAYSPDGHYFATGTKQRQVAIWDITTATRVRSFVGHAGDVNSVTFSPGGEYLVAGGSDRSVRVWRVSDATLLHTLLGHGASVTSVAFSQDGTLLASASIDGTARIWRADTGTLLRTLSGHAHWVTAVAFVAAGRVLATASSDATIRFWRVSDGALLTTLAEFSGPVWALAASADGRTLSSGGWDGIALWSLPVYQPDLLIRAAGDAVYRGDNVYDSEGNQFAEQAVPLGNTAVFCVQLQNDGGISDTFTLTGPAGGDGLTARYVDTFTGVDITRQVTADGWVVGDLPAGDSVEVRVEVTLHPDAPPAGDALLLTVTSQENPERVDTVRAVVTSTLLRAVTLSASPTSPSAVGVVITLLASPVGGTAVEYAFLIEDGAGWRFLRRYTAENSYRWTPASAGTCRLKVWAREQGSGVPFQVYAYLTGFIVRPPVTAVAVAAQPGDPQPVGTPIALTAAATGGNTVEYAFLVNIGSGYRYLQRYSTAATCTWTPTAAGTYWLKVWARERGSSAPFQAYAYLSYRIMP